ncbi:Uncharacterised protein [Bordetella pertussis]|nr:Uncharacterised protein [Bordetella pertussis]
MRTGRISMFTPSGHLVLGARSLEEEGQQSSTIKCRTEFVAGLPQLRHGLLAPHFSGKSSSHFLGQREIERLEVGIRRGYLH